MLCVVGDSNFVGAVVCRFLAVCICFGCVGHILAVGCLWIAGGV